MADAAVRVTGAAQLRAAMKRAGVSLQDLKDANEAVGRMVADAARPVAPRRTGRLAGSLRPAKAAGRARVMAGSASVPYAGPIHWGWEARNIPPNPWVAEAAQDTQVQWLQQYQDALDDIVSTIERTTP